jgi:hypothetical protein
MPCQSFSRHHYARTLDQEEHHNPRTIPIPIETIVELDLRIHVELSLNLYANHRPNACITRDRQTVFVDEKQYCDPEAISWNSAGWVGRRQEALAMFRHRNMRGIAIRLTVLTKGPSAWYFDVNRFVNFWLRQQERRHKS